MRLLVSLCSRTDEAPESLLVADLSEGVIEPVPMADPAFGAFGLSVSPLMVYSVFDHGRPIPDEPELSELRAIDPRTLRLTWRHPFVLGRDVHSICVDDGYLYAVSTGTDELLRLNLDVAGRVTSEEVVWTPDSETGRTDRHHLNDVKVIDSQVVVCGFGLRPAPDAWEGAFDGFVRSVPDGKILFGPVYHPHSICSLGSGELAICESPRRRIVTSSGRVSSVLPGYARGLCLAEGQLYVGTSRNRHPGEPLSIPPHSGGPGDEGRATICELDLDELAVRRVIELSPYGREVYAIVLLG